MPRKISPFLQRHLQQFVGKTIAGVELVNEDLGPVPCLNFSDGTFALIWSDPEGNGPGHLGLYDTQTGAEIVPNATLSHDGAAERIACQ